MSALEETRLSASDQQRSDSGCKSKTSVELLQQQLQEEQQKQEDLKNLLQIIYEKENQRHDDDDVSLQPSFSRFQLPYFIECRNRYNANKKLYEQRFQYEIEQLIAQQATGYEAARLNRHLCVTTIWPPLHSRSEIDQTQRYFFNLTRRERKRLNWIIKTNII